MKKTTSTSQRNAKARSSRARGSTSWVVTGSALIPVQIAITVEAPTDAIAAETAQRIFDTSNRSHTYIVPGSADELSVHDFRWNEVRSNSEISNSGHKKTP